MSCESSSTLASQLSAFMASTRVVPNEPLRSRRDNSISRTKAVGSEASLTMLLYLRTSGRSVETTGSPAARYSRSFSGFALRVSSFFLNGMIPTSNPWQ